MGGLHSSLKVDLAGAQQRSVLTRIERIKDLMKKGLWKENQAVIGLPKTKITKVKARKAAKEKKDDAAAPATGGAPTAAAPAAPTAKPAAKK